MNYFPSAYSKSIQRKNIQQEHTAIAAFLTNHHQPSSPQYPQRKMAANGEIPKMQWAQVFDKCGEPLQYKQIPVPIPGSDEVLIKMKYSGVCHTDLHVRAYIPEGIYY